MWDASPQCACKEILKSQEQSYMVAWKGLVWILPKYFLKSNLPRRKWRVPGSNCSGLHERAKHGRAAKLLDLQTRENFMCQIEECWHLSENVVFDESESGVCTKSLKIDDCNAGWVSECKKSEGRYRKSNMHFSIHLMETACWFSATPSVCVGLLCHFSTVWHCKGETPHWLTSLGI